ncbi:rRNA maturation RNase YbeY [Candidatus Gracilibacteria bacterium]|nr:rRNA maturation RNase YbeY [Candidatus Gracilibacteria bacterium]
MFSYDILQAPDLEIDQTIIDDIFARVEDKIQKTQKGTLNIVFVSSEEIKNFNKQYRNKDKSTDVLSFHYYDDFSDLQDEEVAGEVILCLDKIAPDAKANGVTEPEQIYMLIIHSLLHILGYDHEDDDDYKIMSALEKSIYSEVFGKSFD